MDLLNLLNYFGFTILLKTENTIMKTLITKIWYRNYYHGIQHPITSLDFMNNIINKSLIIFIFLITAFVSGIAQNLPVKPNPPRLVNDFAGFLKSDEVIGLEQKLADFSLKTSTQIAVVTVKDLEGLDISDYATRLGEKWGIGKKQLNNGIVLLIKPKNNTGKGEINISVGYGLESVIPDATAHRIIEEIIIPSFKAGNNFQGIEAGTNFLIKLSLGEFTEKDLPGKKKKSGSPIPFIVIAIIFMVVIPILSRTNRIRNQNIGKSGIPWWIALSMLGGMGRSGGSFSDFSSGSGNFSGGSGFGGFGGGSFGGGGASGSW